MKIIKATYDKFKANILLNGENLKAILLKSEIRQDCTLSHFFSNMLVALARAIWQEKNIEGI